MLKPSRLLPEILSIGFVTTPDDRSEIIRACLPILDEIIEIANLDGVRELVVARLAQTVKDTLAELADE